MKSLWIPPRTSCDERPLALWLCAIGLFALGFLLGSAEHYDCFEQADVVRSRCMLQITRGAEGDAYACTQQMQASFDQCSQTKE